MAPRILLATCRDHAGLAPDDRILQDAMRARGWDAAPAVWDDPEVDWAAADMAIVRSTWDYSHRRDAFLEWADHVEAVSRLANPADTIRWNTDKSYLIEFAGCDIPVVPTVFIKKATGCDPEGLMARYGVDQAVFKPAIGAAGHATYRVDRHADEAPLEAVCAALARQDLLMQPYYPRIVADGEASVVAVDGIPTHAVRKLPAPGEFRVQPRLGGTHVPLALDDTLRHAAEDVLDLVEEPALYARVDMVQNEGGRWDLMELELVEPVLFFDGHPEAVTRLCDRVAARLET